MIGLVFLGYLFLEVVISVNIASRIGGMMTFVEIVTSALIGFYLLTNFRYTLGQSMAALMSGEITIEEFQKMSLFTGIGAVLLILPGFFSDILGVLMQFGFFGTLFAKKILHLKDKKRKHEGEFDDAIDVEVIDVDDYR
ncbi:MAG: exlusion protein FxsA [Campylobacteraceae bacterium 4484_4]|nr:MAG: exlusion protein FxsA [Campylobacteraceae bacterium 4484_4]